MSMSKETPKAPATIVLNPAWRIFPLGELPQHTTLMDGLSQAFRKASHVAHTENPPNCLVCVARTVPTEMYMSEYERAILPRMESIPRSKPDPSWLILWRRAVLHHWHPVLRDAAAKMRKTCTDIGHIHMASLNAFSVDYRIAEEGVCDGPKKEEIGCCRTIKFASDVLIIPAFYDQCGSILRMEYIQGAGDDTPWLIRMADKLHDKWRQRRPMCHGPGHIGIRTGVFQKLRKLTRNVAKGQPVQTFAELRSGQREAVFIRKGVQIRCYVDLADDAVVRIDKETCLPGVVCVYGMLCKAPMEEDESKRPTGNLFCSAQCDEVPKVLGKGGFIGMDGGFIKGTFN